MRVERLAGPLEPLVLREAVDVTETDGAEGASAGRQGAPTGGQRAAAAAGRHRQRAGRQAGGEEETRRVRNDTEVNHRTSERLKSEWVPHLFSWE